MRFPFFLFILVALALAIRSEIEDLSEEEEYIISKYQSLVSATLSGRDIADEDFPESSLDYAVPDVPIPEDFLARLRAEDGLEVPETPLLVPAVADQLPREDDLSSQIITVGAAVGEDSVRNLTLAEENLPTVNTANTESQSHEDASPPLPAVEQTHISDPARDAQVHIATADDIPSHKDESHTSDGIAEAIHRASLNNTPELETQPPLVCDATVIEVRPAYLKNNPSADILERLSRGEQYQDIVPIVSSILSDFEASHIAHKRCTSPPAGSEDPIPTCIVDVSYLNGLKLLHRDDVAGIAQELHICRDHADAITSMQYKSEQQRDLAEIRLKKCRNDITVMKVTAEQQRLVVEEEKVDIEYRLKEAQREIARLRLAVEDLKRTKVQSSAPCDCKNPQDAGSRSHSATPPPGTASEHMPTSGGPSSRVFTTPASSSNAHVHADKGANAKTQEIERQEGTLSYKGPSASKSPFTPDSKNTSLAAGHPEATLSLGSTLGYSLPNWIRHQCAPYMLSFVVWEYRVLFMASKLVASVVDPRIWAFLQSSVMNPIHQRISLLMEAISVDLLALLERVQVAFPWSSWIVHHLLDGMRVASHLSSRYQRFYAEDTAAYSAVASGALYNSQVNATEATTTHTHASSTSTYANLVEYLLEDLHGAYSTCVATIASVSQLKLLFGSRAEAAGRWITIGIVAIVMTLLRKMLLGFLLLALLATFFPILLALLVASSTVSVFMPRKRKIVKKRARKVPDGSMPEHALPQSSQRNESFSAGPPSSSYYQQAASSQGSPRTFIGVRP